MQGEIPVIPGYRIERELGAGGMATVYLGVQEKLNRRVAIKVLSPVLLADKQFIQRFLKEAETAANLHHSNIIPIHDIGQSDNFNYIVMEYLEESLKDRIKKGPLGPDAALDIVHQMARALDYAHSEGFVHRDIKPENIMFRRDGTAVLTDFGIARAVDSATKLTKTGMSIGTPHYMSPEQGRGEKLDGRADIYSLGAVFYEMLTGNVPYDAENTVGVIIKQIQDPIPTLPPQLAKYQPLLDRMMAKDREKRIRSGADLAEFVENAELGSFSKRPSSRSSTDSRNASSPEYKANVHEINVDSIFNKRGGAGRVQAERGDEAEKKRPASRALLVTLLSVALVVSISFLAILLNRSNEGGGGTVSVPITQTSSSSSTSSRSASERAADDAAWKSAERVGTIEAYTNYLKSYPSGYHSLTSRNKIEQLRQAADDKKRVTQSNRDRMDDAAFERAKTENMLWAYQSYLKEYPKGRHVSEANERISILKRATISEVRDVASEPKQSQAEQIPSAIDTHNYGPINERLINEFTSFIGLNYGDTIDKAYEILGEPAKIDMKDDGTNMWDVQYPGLYIYVERKTNRIRGISIYRIEYLQGKYIHDKKLDYIGKSFDFIRSIFGAHNPTESDKKYGPDELRYHTKNISIWFRNESDKVRGFLVWWDYK